MTELEKPNGTVPKEQPETVNDTSSEKHDDAEVNESHDPTVETDKPEYRWPKATTYYVDTDEETKQEVPVESNQPEKAAVLQPYVPAKQILPEPVPLARANPNRKKKYEKIEDNQVRINDQCAWFALK